MVDHPIRDALARPGLTIREAAPGSRLELQDNACVLVFDSEPPASSGPFLHVGNMVEPTQMGPMLVALKLCQEIYLKFQAFAGINVMVARNGYAFDFQVLHRGARRNGRARMPNPTLDTLPMARSYCPGVRHNIDALCERYGIEKEGTRHRALDDARFLHRAFEALKMERASRYRRMAYERLLDQVALGMLFQMTYAKQEQFSHEDQLHFNLGAQRLLGPTKLCIRNLVGQFPRLESDRLRAQARMWLGEDPRRWPPTRPTRFSDFETCPRGAGRCRCLCRRGFGVCWILRICIGWRMRCWGAMRCIY